MKSKEVSTTVTKIETIYIADDGTQFINKSECERHEYKIKKENEHKEIENLMVYEDDYVPCNGAENSEHHIYKWFKVENEAELKQLEEVFGVETRCNKFPEFINIEMYNEDDKNCYSETLTRCEEYVKKFFKAFGKEVIITDTETKLIEMGTRVKFGYNRVGIVDGNDGETTTDEIAINYYICPIEYSNEQEWSDKYIMLLRSEFEVITEDVI